MVKYIKQICIILGICLLAELMEHLIPLPVAASIYGLILTLSALVTKILPLKEVEDVADFLTGNIALLFIPPTVGIMTSVEEIKRIWIPLLVICMVSTLLIMGVTGWATQVIIRKKKGSKET